MAYPMVVYESLANRPHYGEKSLVRRFYEGLSGGESRSRGRGMGHHVGTFRTVSESTVTGGILGAVHAEVGLDLKKVPVDGVLGFLMSILGSKLEANGHETGCDIKNVGVASLTVLGFRKMNALTAEMKLKRGGKPVGTIAAGGKIAGDDDKVGGEFGADFGAEDPIIAAARAL